MNRTPILFLSMLLFAACTENAKTERATSAETDKPGVTVYKYTTEIPPAIIIPDKVETRLGTLTFTDGFPDDSTVQKMYDNLDFSRGVQAFLTAMPAASLVAQRTALRRIGPDNFIVDH